MYSFCADQPRVSSSALNQEQPERDKLIRSSQRVSRFTGDIHGWRLIESGDYNRERKLEEIQHQAVVGTSESGLRLDQALASLFPDYSRSKLQTWLKQGRVNVDGKQLRPKDKVLAGQSIELLAVIEPQVEMRAQDIPLDLVYADSSILVVNKPVGLVVHPAAGNWDGTLQNALLHYDPQLVDLPRAGIVHRLDKDTSGLLVIARTLPAHTRLVADLQERLIKREYRAIVRGVPVAGGTIDLPIDRHPVDRTRMAVQENGKEAVTYFRVLEKYRNHALLQVNLETGRTHQIRVHLAYQGLPIVGDPVYGGRLVLPKAASANLIALLRGFKRQALHAFQLGLEHPETGEWMSWQAPMPEDMQALCAELRKDLAEHGED